MELCCFPADNEYTLFNGFVDNTCGYFTSGLVVCKKMGAMSKMYVGIICSTYKRFIT